MGDRIEPPDRQSSSRCLKLHFETVGDRDAPVIALIHGIMSTNRQWSLNITALAERFHVVMVELWGHGRSPAPEHADAYDAEGFVRAIDEVRRRLGVQTWAILGHSFGGAVALRFALTRPEATTALIFTNSRAALSEPDASAVALIADGLARLASVRDLPQHPLHAKHYPADLRRDLVADADATDPTALEMIIRQSWRLSSRHEVHTLRVPSTLINGVRERGFQTAVADLRSLNPGIRIIELDGGHSINIEAPEQFNAAVIDILSKDIRGWSVRT